MSQDFIYEKKFKNLKECLDFLNYLYSHLKDLKDYQIGLDQTTVQLNLKKTNNTLGNIIKDYDKKTPYNLLKLFCDGGSRGNPGPGACGFVLLDEKDQNILEGGEFFENCTNNYAEYQGLVQGVAAALELKIKTLQIYMDSQLIVKQIKGEYKVKSKDLLPLFLRATKMLNTLSSYEINFIPRRYNQAADSVVNQILDKNL